MPKLIAVTGHSGAGKTTAVNFIAHQLNGHVVYVGQLIANEVARRELAPGPESERIVRLDLRAQHGMASLAAIACSAIQNNPDAGIALVDAVYNLEEFEYYRNQYDKDAQLLSIQASFEIRAERVASRMEKPLTREELLKRDDLERIILRTDVAMTAATLHLDNEGSMAQFERALFNLCEVISKTAGRG